MSVASPHHGLLETCVSNAFNEILKCQSAPSRADDALQAGRDVEAAVQTAVRRCYNAWNEAHRDPVLRLPKELVLEFFALLDIKGRTAATHVSRAWRSLALSDYRLWNSLSLKQKRPAVALDMLTTFLRRSDPKPFALSSMRLSDTVSRPLLELIIDNMHRMESIAIDHLPRGDLELLFSARAPILRTFVYDGLLDLSSLWAGDMAPCLETVDVRMFSVSAAFRIRPLTSVRKFGSDLRINDAPPELLFKIFPGLTSLDLRGITQQAINDLGPLLPSVTSLSLHTARLERTRGVDYAAILPTLSRLRLSTLFLGSASTVASIVQLFVETTRGERRRIAIPWRGDVQLDSDTDNVHFTINSSYLSLSLEKEPGLLAPLRAFSDLSLTLDLLVELRGVLPKGDRTLPNVRALTVILDWMDDLKYPPAERSSSGGPPPVCAPHLASLAFTVHFVGSHPHDTQTRLSAFGAWLGAGLPDVLPRVLAYPKASVTLQAEDTEYLARCGAENLQRLARESGLALGAESRIKTRNLRTGEVTELPLDQDAGVLSVSQ